MLVYVARRILETIPVLIVVSVIAFALINFAGGDPAAYLVGTEGSSEDYERLRRHFQLDLPIHVRFGDWFVNALRGDLGSSLFTQEPVGKMILQSLEPSLLLAIFSSAIGISTGLLLGVVAATSSSRWIDQLSILVAMVGVSMPVFWLSLNLILIFSVWAHILPSSGYPGFAREGMHTFRYLILPSVAVGLLQSALIARTARASMLEVLGQEYVRTARAKGLAEQVVIYKHALRNALIPIVTIIGLSLAATLGQGVVTETVFAIPGVGRLLVFSVARRDYPVVQGTMLFAAVIYVGINFFLDMLYAVINPRIRYA
jgi:peptide/nickel transport system permease protein